MQITMRDVDANGWRFRCREAGGPGEPVILLHGFPETWYSWRHQLRALADNHRVVAIDLRGYGASDRPAARTDYTLPLLVADVVAAVKALGRDSCTLFGHDWGGAVAWAVADKHPEIVERLAVFNIPHPAIMAEALRSNSAQIRRSWYIFFFQLPFLPERMLRRDIHLVFSQIRGERLKDRDIAVFRLNTQSAATSMVNYYRNLFNVSGLRQRWRRLEMPVLQVWGENDTALGVELTQGTVRFAPQLTQKFVPDCSHWVTQDRPAIVNAHVAEWLRTTTK